MKFASTLVGILFLGTACGMGANSYLNNDPPGDAPPGLQLQPYLGVVSQTFQQAAKPLAFDILITLDSEKDILTWYSAFSGAIGNLLTPLQNAGTDFRFGVIPSDIAIGTAPSLTGPTPVVTAQDPTAAADLLADLNATDALDPGNNPPRPFSSAQDFAASAAGPTFFRTGAAPVLLAFSDADDIKYFSATATDISSFLSSFAPQAPTGHPLILYVGSPSDNPCADADILMPPFMGPLALQSGGKTLRICDISLSDHMTEAANIILSLTWTYPITLSLPPEATPSNSTFVLTVNGIVASENRQTGYSWNHDSHSIVFAGSFRPQPGDVIIASVQYTQL